jgi:ATP-dependent DNA helicase
MAFILFLWYHLDSYSYFALVERSLPKKKEYLLYAPLTQPQKALYDAIIKRDIRGYLIKRKANINDTENNVPELDEKRNNKKNNVSYKEVSDRQFFKELEQEKPSQEPVNGDIIKKEEEMSQAIRQVNGMHLQNIVMQLRKVCNHPFLFDWPIDPQTSMPILNNELAAQSGKVLLLDCLLTALFKRGHKVLVFSQMTKMLDILEDWAVHLKKWNTCRLDGAVSQENRRQQIETFQDPESNVNLFLLSTRAGGLGINLTVADTVIIFDSDWVSPKKKRNDHK